jgi:subfamily B ATP-binding cassette protein MsbA
MKKLAKLNNALQTGLGAAERVFALMDRDIAIYDKPNAKILNEKSPSIEFKDVEFGYEEKDVRALNKINISINKGHVTALVGPSGGGKSTVMNLIPRFYDVDAGSIEINGHNIQNVTMESLRSHIALVSQDITIFDDTVASNIRYSKQDATDEEVVEAAKMAFAHDFIEDMQDGYNTILGEDGVRLSGGQRQRIAIARAILRDAPILLLDEATSALDNESEQMVQNALKKLEKGRTTLVIAHRLSTVQNADQIIVLDNGSVVETGTHDALIDKGGLYAHMHKAGL